MIEINAALLVAQILTFLIAVFLLWKGAWKGLTETLISRREQIKNDLELIEKTRESTHKLEAEYKSKLVEIGKEVQAVMLKAEQDAAAERAVLVKAAQQEVNDLRRLAREQIARERERMQSESVQEAFDLSCAVTERILAHEIDRGVHERLFNEMVKEMSQPGAGGADAV